MSLTAPEAFENKIFVKNKSLFVKFCRRCCGFMSELFRTNKVVFLISFLILGKLVYLDWCSSGYLKAPLVGSAGTLLFIFGPVVFFFPKRKLAASLVIDIIVSVFLITDLVYFRYYNDVFSMSALSYAGQIGTITEGIFSLFRISDLLIFADIFILLPKLMHQKNKILCNYEIPTPKETFFNALAFLFIAIVLLFSQLPFDRNDRMLIIKQYGLLLYHGYDFGTSAINLVAVSPPTEDEKRQVFNRFNSVPQLDNYKFTGFGKGKNLILIQVESLQNFVINLTVNGQVITPNLNKLLDKSIYFPNFYTQAANWTTSDAEFIVNNSLYPIKTAPVYRAYYRNTYHSIATVLREMGYSTTAMHGYRSSYWNRESAYPAQGIGRFLSESNYTPDEKIGWGLADKSFLQQSIKVLKDSKQPYYSFLITLTSHIPYSLPANYKKLMLGKYEGTMAGNYLHAIHYVDEALGEFIKEAERQGVLKNSVLVIYGDHWALPLNELERITEVAPGNLLTERMKVPLIITIPSTNINGKRNIPAGQIDLFPTLANIMGIPPGSLFTMGRDLLNSDKGFVIFNDGSYIDSNNIYHAASDYTSNITEREKVKNELRISELIIRENMIPDLIRNKR